MQLHTDQGAPVLYYIFYCIKKPTNFIHHKPNNMLWCDQMIAVATVNGIDGKSRGTHNVKKEVMESGKFRNVIAGPEA